MIDAESEYEGKYVAAQSYITQLRKLIGQSYPVALAGFPYIDYHPGFPVLGVPRSRRRPVQLAADVLDGHRHERQHRVRAHLRVQPRVRAPDRSARAGLRRTRRWDRSSASASCRGPTAPPACRWWDWQQASASGWGSISIGAGNLIGVTPTTTTPILKLGSVGDLVVWAQEHLASAGYTTAIDGDYGPSTQAAVESFQTAEGLTADGIVGPATWAALLRFAPARRRLDHSLRRDRRLGGGRAQRARAASSRWCSQVPKSAHARAVRDEIAGAGGAG